MWGKKSITQGRGGATLLLLGFVILHMGKIASSFPSLLTNWRWWTRRFQRSCLLLYFVFFFLVLGVRMGVGIGSAIHSTLHIVDAKEVFDCMVVF